MGIQTTKMKVVLVSDQPLMIEGLRAILATRSDLEVIGEAHSATSAVNKIRETPPDVVISDIILSAPDAICSARSDRGKRVSVKLLMLSKSGSTQNALSALASGASGCLPVHATRSDLLSAIAALSEGNCYLSESVASALVLKCQRLEDRRPNLLTERQQTVLKLIVKGSTTQAIAEIMGLTIPAVKAERKKMMSRLRVRNMIGLVKFGIQQGIGDESTNYIGISAE